MCWLHLHKQYEHSCGWLVEMHFGISKSVADQLPAMWRFTRMIFLVRFNKFAAEMLDIVNVYNILPCCMIKPDSTSNTAKVFRFIFISPIIAAMSMITRASVKQDFIYFFTLQASQMYISRCTICSKRIHHKYLKIFHLTGK